MRKLRLLSMAVVLALVLAAPAFAGITDTPPAPPPPAQESLATASGIIETPPSAVPTDPVVSVTLTVIQTVLSVF